MPQSRNLLILQYSSWPQMNPASQIVRRVFPSSTVSAEKNEAPRRNSHCGNFFAAGQKKSSDYSANQQQIQRLRETVFRLNMDIAASRGAKQRLEKTVYYYQSMENYYLTELEVRKARADCLESQLALILEEFPSHKPLKAPCKAEGCEGCQDSQRVITKLAHQLNLKNQLLILLDNSYKEVMDRVSSCLKDQKPLGQQSTFEDDKENAYPRKSQSIETQTPQPTRHPLEPSEAFNHDEPRGYKKSKVILKRVMPQRENSFNYERNQNR